MLETQSRTNGLSLALVDDDDQGIYDAVAQGFARAEDADVYCYLGAGDCFSPHALEVVAELFAQGEQWLVGLICGYNDRGHMIEAQVPFRYRGRLIRKGVYGRFLPYVQQESCFWSRALHQRISWPELTRLTAAGDAFIWHTFALICEPTVVECWLSGFEIKEGQFSSVNAQTYRQEHQRMSEAMGISDWLLTGWDWLVWHSPRRVKRALNPSRYIYDPQQHTYRRMNQSQRD